MNLRISTSRESLLQLFWVKIYLQLLRISSCRVKVKHICCKRMVVLLIIHSISWTLKMATLRSMIQWPFTGCSWEPTSLSLCLRIRNLTCLHCKMISQIATNLKWDSCQPLHRSQIISNRKTRARVNVQIRICITCWIAHVISKSLWTSPIKSGSWLSLAHLTPTQASKVLRIQWETNSG